jgi:BMFP domain-containing protein YqiC
MNRAKGTAMQSNSRILDDLTKVAGGAVSTLAGLKAEIDGLVRQRIERLFLKADMVPRDEFDAVKAMAAKARAEQERLEQRLQALEARLAGGGKAAKRAVGTRRKKVKR